MNKSFAAAFALLLCAGFASAQQQTDHAREVGKKVRCMCGGCSDTAGTCYHVGGAFSGPCDQAKKELKEIGDRLAKGDSDDLVLQSMIQEYGTAAFVEPPHSGFGQVAWATPAVCLVAGTILVIFVIKRWRRHPAIIEPIAASPVPVSPDALQQARRRVEQDTED
jgi:cytochrome c-type biogenesis protein CcmH/NrfF